MVVAPGGAAETESQVGDGLGLLSEGRFLHVDAIAHGGFALGVAPVGSLHPVDGGGPVAAPAEIAGAWLDGIAVDGQIVDQWGVVKHLGFAAGNVEDFASLRKSLVGLRVREWPMQFLREYVFPVGRGLQLGEDARLPELSGGATANHDFSDLRGCVKLEDAFVGRSLEQVFIGGRGRSTALILLHDGAGGNLRVYR